MKKVVGEGCLVPELFFRALGGVSCFVFITILTDLLLYRVFYMVTSRFLPAFNLEFGKLKHRQDSRRSSFFEDEGTCLNGIKNEDFLKDHKSLSNDGYSRSEV